jgi:hypothetical protein
VAGELKSDIKKVTFHYSFHQVLLLMKVRVYFMSVGGDRQGGAGWNDPLYHHQLKVSGHA